MKIPLTDLKLQYLDIKKDIHDAIQKVIEKCDFILGEDVGLFEKELAEYCGVRYGIGVASGTDALLLSLAALGLKEGDEVITTPFTFIATTEAIVRLGAIPVFSDIDPDTYNLDPIMIKEKITTRTRAIIPVHLYGQCCDMDPILDIAKEKGISIIEDCAQSIGAEYKGRKAGSMGDMGCFSFFPAKTLGCYGDGGMIVTDNQNYAEKLDILHKHGAKSMYLQEMHGYNSRLDTIQAAILRVKLKHLDKWIEARRANARLYSDLLAPLKDHIMPLNISGDVRHSFNYFTLKVRGGKEKRDLLIKHLLNQGISCGVYYPVSMHLQFPYQYLGYKKGAFPVSENAQTETISLPMFPELDKKAIEYITGHAGLFFKS